MATERLLNALNQGDYDLFTRLCDPHMTSFEPENLGNLVDNMQYRLLCLDQARQLQRHLEQLSLGGAGAQLHAQQQAAPARQPGQQHYSLMLNPSVYLLGDDAAFIAYTRLSQSFDLSTGRINVEQCEETRVWHRKDGNQWLCVHLHRSIVNTSLHPQQLLPQATPSGPQTSLSLVRTVTAAAASHQQQQLVASSQHPTITTTPTASTSSQTQTASRQ